MVDARASFSSDALDATATAADVSDTVVYERLRSRARQRAKTRLVREHQEEFDELLHEELRRLGLGARRNAKRRSPPSL